MIRYFSRRLFHAVLVFFGVSLLLFILQQATPGDYLSDVRLNPQISAETLQALRHQYGLDQSLPVRYVHWLGSAARGDWGYSFAYNLPASRVLWPRVRNTLLLTVPALLLAWIIAVPLGVLASARSSGWVDRCFAAGTSALLALPDVLLALLALLLALSTHLFPVGGMTSAAGDAQSTWQKTGELFSHMVLPVAVLVIGAVGPIARQARASTADVISSSYFRAASGHGLGRFTLLFRHALPAGANPLISLFGLSAAFLLSTSVLVEIVMSWPGLGPLLLQAIFDRDIFLVLGAVMISTGLLVLGNLVADVLLYICDPRIRVQP